MASVYSQPLYRSHNLGTDSFVVPEGYTWVARTLTYFCGSSNGNTLNVVDHFTGGTIWYVAFATNLSGVYQIEPDCRFVWEQGTQIDLVAVAGVGADAPDVMIYGYSLALP